MPVTLNLAENGYVMHFVISDPWDVRDMIKYYPEQHKLLDDATHPLFTFIDMTATRRVPSGLLAARQQAPSVTHPKSSYIVLVGASSLVQTLADTGFKVMHFNRVKFFRTSDEGWQFLRQIIASEEPSPITENAQPSN